jgi:DNA polymerase III alpha subunit
MKTDKNGVQVLTEDDLCHFYMENPDAMIKRVIAETSITFDNNLELQNIPKIEKYISLLETEQFDKLNQDNWFMPEEYKTMDIAKFVLDQCNGQEELQRAGEELLLYQEREMFPLLRYLKYLVDTMRQHNIVWGVGRGSSVASFVLFLIGIHRINSLYYDLSIDEFLK